MHQFTVGTEQPSQHFLKSAQEVGGWGGPRPFVEVARGLEGKSIAGWPREPLLGAESLNAFYHGFTLAFSQHVPLRVSPDAVWLHCLNGLVQHIDEDPEGLRHHFVEHGGKERLEVWVQGAEWPQQGVGLISGLLKERLGKRHDLIVASFTTTQEGDRLASEIMLMGAMKHWFEYRMMLLCGLTEVTVLGEPSDWESIKTRLQVFAEFGLGWWTGELLPIIDQFKSACAGSPDIAFWKRMYVRQGRGSGSQHGFTGWLTAFFPYLQGPRGVRYKNPGVNWALEGGPRVDADDLPGGLSQAPVTLVHQDGSEHPHKFYGGVVGSQFRDGAVEPVTGWTAQELGAR